MEGVEGWVGGGGGGVEDGCGGVGCGGVINDYRGERGIL